MTRQLVVESKSLLFPKVIKRVRRLKVLTFQGDKVGVSLEYLIITDIWPMCWVWISCMVRQIGKVTHVKCESDLWMWKDTINRAQDRRKKEFPKMLNTLIDYKRKLWVLNDWSRELLGEKRKSKAEKEEVEAKYLCEWFFLNKTSAFVKDLCNKWLFWVTFISKLFVNLSLIEAMFYK